MLSLATNVELESNCLSFRLYKGCGYESLSIARGWLDNAAVGVNGKAVNDNRVQVRSKFLPADQLLARTKIMRKRGAWAAQDVCELEVELNSRIALALSPIAFLLLGLPLAIRTSRRETSVGLFLSVILGGVFFLSIVVIESLAIFPAIRPQYLIWLPNLVFQALGATLLYRVSQQ
jgi:lipopolysaccharide export LptBFGC system permease protein LptF